MGRFIIRRLIQAVPTLLGILVITFALTRLSPADPVTLIVGDAFGITQADRDRLAEAYGLNDPVPVQFVHYLGKVAVLDFANSF